MIVLGLGGRGFALYIILRNPIGPEKKLKHWSTKRAIPMMRSGFFPQPGIAESMTYSMA